MALTVGVATVLDSREVLVVVTGQRKSLALSKAIEGGVNHLVRYNYFVVFVYISDLSAIHGYSGHFRLSKCTPGL